MKLVRFDDDRTGLIVGNRVVDVVESSTPDADAVRELVDSGSWVPLIEGWSQAREHLASLEKHGASGGAGVVLRELDSVRLRPPLPAATSRVFAMGTNFADHLKHASAALGMEDPTPIFAARPPAGFFVIPGTIVGPEDLVTPPGSARKVDYEAEVAVVLAAGGRNLSQEDVRFWGVTGWNDLSIRDPHLGLSDLDKGTLAWALQKNFDGGNACGPWLVVDEGLDVTNLAIRCRVNGELRQDGSTAQMLRPFGEAAAYISEFLALAPGDLFVSGTPSGTAIEGGMDGPFLTAGDVVEVEIEGVGVLRNKIGQP